MNLRAVAGLLSQLVGLIGAALGLPLLWSLIYGESESGLAILGTIAIASATALVLRLIGGPRETRGALYRRDGILIVAGGWLLASLIGAIPYLLSGYIPDPADALFESASGFTTTGASVLTEIEAVGRGILFWRSLTQWLGGLGIIVLFVALLSELGPGARFLYRLEVPGPTAEVLSPHVRQSALVLWQFYLGLTLLLTVLLLLCGMGPYDALSHSFTTLSTGGFSPYGASVAAFDSPAIDSIITVFMVIAGINFSLFFGIRRKGLGLFKDRELALYLALLFAATVYISRDLLHHGQASGVGEAVRYASFQAASLMTTTGFATADFDVWSDSSRALLLGLMILGGCAGSTAGGLKVMRALIAWKAALRESRRIFRPNTIMPIAIGDATVPGWVSSSVAGFVILYFALLLLGALILALSGHDLLTASSAALACLGNIGPGIEAVGPTRNFAHFGSFEKLVLVALMWLGRLEILAITATLHRSFWRP